MTIMAPAAPHKSLGPECYLAYTQAYGVYLRTLTHLNVSKEKVSLAKTESSLTKARLSAKTRSDKAKPPKASKRGEKTDRSGPGPAKPSGEAKPQVDNRPESLKGLKMRLLEAQINALNAAPTPAPASMTTTVAGPATVNNVVDTSTTTNTYNVGAASVSGPRAEFTLGTSTGRALLATSSSVAANWYRPAITAGPGPSTPVKLCKKHYPGKKWECGQKGGHAGRCTERKS